MTPIVRFAILLCCVLLTACFSRPRTVVVAEPGSRGPGHATPSTVRYAGREYVVARGDTLYGIAFRHDLDFRALARWNRIDAPYTIYPGQRLRLDPGSGASAPPRSTRPAATPGGGSVLGPIIADRPASDSAAGRPVAPATAATSTAPASATAPPAPPAAAPSSTAPSASAPSTSAPSTSAPSTSAPAGTAPAASATPPAASASAPAGTNTAQGVVWRWPASGQIVSRYQSGDPTRQGINIAGSSGQPVFAAAQGEVVYSGSGLIGYGELVIIKHSEEFLSAYGHNRKRLVNEGQRVAAGQQIAEMGRSGAARDMLHFEIRRNGKPIDPLPLLPRR